MAKYKYSTIFLMMLMLQVFSSSGFSPQREPPSKLTFVVNINMMDSAKLHKDDRIVGGSVVDSEYKYPYQALFAGDHVKCGATIINRNHAITADHCIQIDAPNKDTFVIVGHHRLSSTDVFGPDADAIFGRDLVRVEGFIRYEKPNYDDYKDIAILRMKNDFMLSSRVQPACIADNLSQYYIGWDAVVTGWGATQHGAPSSSDQLREVTLKVLEPGNKICQRSGGFYSKETKICAYSRGKDSCQGDSGGPLTVTQNGKFVLIGVVSSGKGCANSAYSGIYVRISAFADWIKRNAGDVCTQDSGTSQFKPTTSTRKPIPTSTRNPILTSTRKPIFSMATMKPVNPIVSASSGCTCTSFINRNGYGQCKKGDSDFGGSVSCYVALPSSCNDLVRSGSHPKKFVSAEACVKHMGHHQTTSVCTCTEFINPNGFGKCQKSDFDFGGSVSCYVDLPSSCKDLVRSGSHPNKFLSSEACGNNQGHQGCICIDFINPNGFGQCKKADSDFGGSVSCYVALPSLCQDLLRSGKHPKKFLSSEACDHQTSTQQPNNNQPIYQKPIDQQASTPRPQSPQSPQSYNPRPYIPQTYSYKISSNNS